ncbi:hypothetical protein QJS04_geneDACA006559 [Acorus gramineus]|uniref:TF-B3 domain-containing protein n=1 Tax=Acorus gramineus TaxID=55184 RepID=A0AAV9B003_ACOGR|nr:hypothetical protein QJS04_geneDACA006559 [Acorus gramineus]
MGFSPPPPPPPSNPLFFKILLLDFHKRLSIPPKFVRKHLAHANCNKNRATIKSPLGRSWDVCVHVNKEGHFFEDGWCVFARDHDLSAGDLLVFEYEGRLDFNVKLFDHSACEREYTPSAKISKPSTTSPSGCVKRGSSNEDCKMSVKLTTNPNGSASLKRRASCDESEVDFKRQTRIYSQINGSPCLNDQFPSFKHSIKPSNLVDPYLYIPGEFVESNGFENGSQVMLRDPKGRSWEVQIYHRHRNKNWSQLRGQWHEFVIANGLRSGDVCVFELMGGGEKDVMDVRIIKGQSIKNNSSDEFKTKFETSTLPDGEDCKIKLKKQLTRSHPIKEENALPQSRRRCFKASIKPSNLKLSYMNIPREFIESNGLQHTCKVRMRNTNGRSWEVSIHHRQVWHHQRSQFTRGWLQFVHGNGFKIGDVLVFEFDPDVKDIIDVKMDKNVVLV